MEQQNKRIAAVAICKVHGLHYVQHISVQDNAACAKTYNGDRRSSHFVIAADCVYIFLGAVLCDCPQCTVRNGANTCSCVYCSIVCCEANTVSHAVSLLLCDAVQVWSVVDVEPLCSGL